MTFIHAIVAIVFAGIALIPAETALAHADNCPDGQARPADGGPCKSLAVAELYDWCNNATVDGSAGTPQVDNIFGNETCAFFEASAEAVHPECVKAGFRGAPYSGIRCVLNSSGLNGCAKINNGNAEYVFAATHSCQCKFDSGDPDAGTCGCPQGTFLLSGSCRAPGEQCPTDQNKIVDSDGACAQPNDALLAEVRKTQPDSAIIVTLLNAGASPNHASVLKIAVEMAHVDAVSILVTAGANPSVTFIDSFNRERKSIPHYLVVNHADNQDRNLESLPWQRAAEFLFAFGNAVDIAEVQHNYDYNWDEKVGTGHVIFHNRRAVDYTDFRYRTDALSPTQQDKEAILAMAYYLRQQGSSCTEGLNTTCGGLDNLRPTCQAGGNSLQVAYCGFCAGLPMRSADGNSCVAQECPANLIFHTRRYVEGECGCADPRATLSGGICQCPAGEILDNGVCRSASDFLLAEIRKTTPNVSSVVAHLNSGANPNYESNGDSLLAIAVTLGLAEVMSVLITAGANPSVGLLLERTGNILPIPHFLMANGDIHSTGTRRFEWRRAANLLFAFGDALAAGGIEFDWTKNDSFGFNAVSYARSRLTSAVFSPNPEDDEAIFAMASYLRAKGVPCIAEGAHPICDYVPPTCGDSTAPYCGLCSDSPFRSPDGNSCLAQCGNGAGIAEDSIYLEEQCECLDSRATFSAGTCQCPAGEFFGDDGMCFNPHPDLLAEIRKTTPNLSSIVAILNSGANPNYVDNGNPVLKIAVEMGHAEVMSILITAGANPNNVRFTESIYNRDIAHYIAHNDRDPALIPSPLNPRFAWAKAARMLYAFGNAVSIANANFDWNRFERTSNSPVARRAIEHLANRHGAANFPDGDKPILLAMAAHLKKQGATCRTNFGGRLEAPCTYLGPTCPAGGNEYDCGECAGYPIRSPDGNSCVAHCGSFAENSFYPEMECACEGVKTLDNDGNCQCPAGFLENESGQCQCPAGKQLDANSIQCVCTGVKTPDADGNCQCPAEFIEDDNGQCQCPDGKYLNANSNQCVNFPSVLETDFSHKFRPLCEGAGGTYTPLLHAPCCGPAGGANILAAKCEFTGGDGNCYVGHADSNICYPGQTSGCTVNPNHSAFSFGWFRADNIFEPVASTSIPSAHCHDAARFFPCSGNDAEVNGVCVLNVPGVPSATLRSLDSSASLSWSSAPSAGDSPRYVVRRSVNGGSAISIALVSTLYYVDSELSGGWTVRYDVGLSGVYSPLSEPLTTSCDSGLSYSGGVCGCPAGKVAAAGGQCEIPLVAEVGGTNPDSVSVLALLNSGANPNASDSNGNPVLKIAVSLGHAELASILITAGAIPQSVSFGSAVINDQLLHTRIHHFLTQNQDGSGGRLFEWGHVATLFFHLDGGIENANPSPFNDWNARDANNHRALNYLQSRYDGALSLFSPSAEDDAAMLVIAAFLRGKGTGCSGRPNIDTSHLTCAHLGPMCPDSGGNVYSCSRACSGYPLRDSDATDSASCVAECSGGKVGIESKWLENACACPNADDIVNHLGNCGPDLDPALLSETNKNYNESAAAAVAASVIALLSGGADPDAMTNGSFALGRAGFRGHPLVVSILLTAGANPNGKHGNRTAVQQAARNMGAFGTSRSLDLVRHFILGLQIARENDPSTPAFIWSTGGDSALRLAASFNRTLENDPDAVEFQALIFERGGRCDSMTSHHGSSRFCQIPVQSDNVEVGGEAGNVLTLTARDYGGDEFNLELPPSVDLLALSDSGWTVRLESESRPHRVVAGRSRARQVGDIQAVFTITARAANIAANNGSVVRRYHVSLYNESLYSASVSAPQAPPNFTASQIADVEFGILLSWDVPPQGGAAITAWVLQSAAAVAANCAGHSFSDGDYSAVSDSGLTANSLSLSYAPPEGDREKCLSFRLAAQNTVDIGPWSYSGNLTLSLSALTRLRNAAASGDAAAAASALSEIESGSRRDLKNDAGEPLVPRAAQNGHAELVSVLVAGGVEATAAFSNGRAALHLVARNTSWNAPGFLNVLRHFLGGLNESGRVDSFDGWNEESDVGRPLESLHDSASENDNQLESKREIHRLFYERGARCENPDGKSYCQIPFVGRALGWHSEDYEVGVLTISARDDYGWEFDLSLPDSGALSSLGNSGWGLELASGRPHRAVLSRTRARRAEDSSALLTITMTRSGEAAGLFAAAVSLTGAFDQCVAAECGANERCEDADFSALNSDAEICRCSEGWIEAGDVCRYVPEGPGNLAGVLSGDLDSPVVEFSWEAPNTNGETVEGYILWRGSTVTDFSGCSPNVFQAEFLANELTRTSGDENFYSDADVEYGNCYGYAVAARTSATVGARAGAAAVYVWDVPGPVAGLAATVIGDGDVSLSWEAPVNLRGSELSGYKIFREVNAGGFEELTTLGSDVLRYVDAAAPSGSALSYHVRAESDAGPGEELAELDYAQAETEATHECDSGRLPIAGETAREFCRQLGTACEGTSVDTGSGRYWRRGGNGDEAVCGCPNPEAEFQLGSECVLRAGSLTESGLDLRRLCRAFEGESSAGGEVCLDLDAAGTFCVLDAREALPCEGLLKHVRECNLLNRFALNPFLCGSACPENQYAAGGKCCDTDGNCNTPQ